MGSLETEDLRQVAVLWSKSGAVADDFGRDRVGRPVEIRCRWEQTLLDPDSKAVVYVDRRIEPNSILWLGALADLPSALTDLMEVITCEEVPDIKGRNFQRTVTLVKYNNQLPESE